MNWAVRAAWCRSHPQPDLHFQREISRSCVNRNTIQQWIMLWCEQGNSIRTHQRAEGNNLEEALQCEEGCEEDVQVFQHGLVQDWSGVALRTEDKNWYYFCCILYPYLMFTWDSIQKTEHVNATSTRDQLYLIAQMHSSRMFKGCTYIRQSQLHTYILIYHQ